MSMLRLAFVVGFAALAAPVGAQTGSSLGRVDELARAGRTEEARTLLMAWWEGERGEASRRDVQWGYWLRGRLTVDPAQADLDFRRLVIEYPGGPYSDAALLRLAQSALARGDSLSAAEHVGRLRTEYPSGAALREAERWLEQVGPLPEVPARTAEAAQPVEQPTPPERDTVAAAPPEDSVPDQPVPEGTSTLGGDFAVQLGAFSSGDRARVLLAELEAAGSVGRLAMVEGSVLIRVRVGRFETRAEADEMAARLRDAGFAVVVVDDAASERPVGG